jgi:hypothetical protein
MLLTDEQWQEEERKRKEHEEYRRAVAGWGHNPEYDSGRGC